MKRRAYFLCYFLFFLCSTMVFAGENITPHRFDKEYYFATVPKVVGITGSKVRIAFTTSKPTPPAKVVFGISYINDKCPEVFYRKDSVEKSDQDLILNHQVVVNISKIENKSLGPHLIAEKGGEIHYLIEGYDRTTGKLNFFPGKFAYKRIDSGKESKYELAPFISEGPFVNNLTHNAVIVSWETQDPQIGKVFIHDKQTGLKGEFDCPRADNRHEILISPLRPDSEYEYQVVPSKNGFAGPKRTFRTAPAPGMRKPFRFAFLSDGRKGPVTGLQDVNAVNGQTIGSLLNSLRHAGADFVIFGGDLVNGYVDKIHQFESQLSVFKYYAQFCGGDIPIYTAMGNHESVGEYFRVPDPKKPGEAFFVLRDRTGKDAAEELFSKHFVNPVGSYYRIPGPEPETREDYSIATRRQGPNYGESVYSFNWGNCHFVILNTNYWTTALVGDMPGSSRSWYDHEGTVISLNQFGGNREGYLMKNQLSWLERDLHVAEFDRKIDNVFVILHEPMFPNGGHAKDALYWGKENHEEHTGLNDPNQTLGDVGDMRRRFLKILTEHSKVVAVMNGDEHNYSRTLVDSSVDPTVSREFWQIISGGAGAPYYLAYAKSPWKKNVRCFSPLHHYCIIEVNGPQVALKVYSETGDLVDSCFLSETN